jgi:ATP-dependent Clp protease ATP-binding subunit ClpC
MPEGLTEELINIIVLAQEESRRLGQNFVCTEQILVGTIREETSVAAKVLKSTGVTLEQVRIEVEKIIGRSSDLVTIDNVPFSPKAIRAIDLSEEEAQQLGSSRIDAEHLLLATLRIEDGIALQVLTNLGISATEIRDLVIRMLGEKTKG